MINDSAVLARLLLITICLPLVCRPVGASDLSHSPSQSRLTTRVSHLCPGMAKYHHLMSPLMGSVGRLLVSVLIAVLVVNHDRLSYEQRRQERKDERLKERHENFQ